MKVLVIAEEVRKQSLAYMEEAARSLGPQAEVEKELFSDPAKDFSEVILRLESHGPDPEPVPAFFENHADCEIVFGNFCPFNGSGMDVLKSAHVIGITRGGTENINIDAATERGIAVLHTPGRNANAVSDYAIGMMLAECRNIAKAHHKIKCGIWTADYPNSAHIPDLFGKTVGLVGTGYIGRLMAQKLHGFEVNILGYDPYVTQEQLAGTGITLVKKEELFESSDFISVHARLTEESHHMIGKAEFALMKPTAYFINTARSGLVDTDALIEALQEGRIAGAALDVFDHEPLEPDSPFLLLENVTLTPHRAGGTLDALEGSPRLQARNMGLLFDGKPTIGFKNPAVLENPKFKAWLQTAASRLGR